MEATVFLQPNLESAIASLLYYILSEVSEYVQFMVKRRRLHKSMNTKRQRLLMNIVEFTYYIPVASDPYLASQ